MANMSYCRFTNTCVDLQDCFDAILQSKPLSTIEAQAGRDMFNEFLALCQEYDIIDVYDNEAFG